LNPGGSASGAYQGMGKDWATGAQSQLTQMNSSPGNLCGTFQQLAEEIGPAQECSSESSTA